MVDPMDLGLTDEDIPNDRSDDVVSAISGISESEDADRQQLVTVNEIRMPPNVLVTSATDNILLDQDPLKTTRIIIHSPASLDVLKNSQPTITFNSLNRSLSVPEKNTINFDPSVYDPVLPVRCRTVRGELHKNKFGSGSRGRCISVNGSWVTPSEFETLGGRGNSKDWKRSIRYGGRTLQCLIEQGILRPHATTCTCGNCCDDNLYGDGSPDVSSGPVRLFTPYKRRKRQHPRLKVETNVALPTSDNIVSAPAELHTDDITSTSLTPESVVSGLTVPMVTSNTGTTICTVPLVTRESGNAVCADSVIVKPESKLPKLVSSVVDITEQKHWWQLEEMVKNAVRQILDLQKHVETVKNQCVATREAALQDLRNQMEEEKKQALSACRLEAQLALSRASLEAKNEKEAAVQEALQQAQLEMQEKLNALVTEKSDTQKHCANCDREAFSECTGCHRVSYCSTFCQRKDWLAHKHDCGDCDLAADCSELPDSDDPTS
ncbi:deformed epidermal autoregulatory factor 1 homolog isoform X2 [Parasteatoda tepidariorum]|uniref:deformed epidermal autoregulatory factor 1 homolog isoform X2 n=1 Tax=Parasteatoda tepidariorum TaxID=114398 RepID=UPI00077FAB8B|nr:deformed epidermal autoregulatory factor 1 homolog isoform X2 [Parasteatoda tepidariorum]